MFGDVKVAYAYWGCIYLIKNAIKSSNTENTIYI